MRKKFLPCGIALIACALFASGCGNPVQGYTPPTWQEYRQSGSTKFEGWYSVMGTDAILNIVDKDNFKEQADYERAVALWNSMRDFLDGANSSLSANLATSCIYKFNTAQAGTKVEIDKTCYDVLTLAKSVYEFTGGYYNPAVYSSVRLFSGSQEKFTQPQALPTQGDVEAYRQLGEHFSELVLSEENGAYYATKPQFTVLAQGATHSLKIDLGGIGKGWCTDKVKELTAQSGFEYGYFNFGSSSIALGKFLSDSDDCYNLSLRDPRAYGGSYSKIVLKDVCVSTSADDEQYYEIDGVRYCHIIDPATGAPIANGAASATVVGGTAAENDALTTALCAMGKERAVEFINEKLTDRIVVMLFFEEGQGKIITNAPDRVQILKESYALINTVNDGKIILN